MDAADGVGNGHAVDQADKGQGEADSTQHDPRFHEADVPLKYITFNRYFCASYQ